MGFPGGAVVKNPPAGLIPGLASSPGEENGNPLQYSCLENSMNRGDWWAIDHGVTKKQTRLSIHTHKHTHRCNGSTCQKSYNCTFKQGEFYIVLIIYKLYLICSTFKRMREGERETV